MKKNRLIWIITGVSACVLFVATQLWAQGVEPTAISADFNATGLWSYYEPFNNHDCSFEYTPKTGQVVIIQSDDEFVIVGLEKTLTGKISEGKYTYSDIYYQHDGWINVTAEITFTSDVLGTGMAIWTWTDLINPKICSGLYHITIIKIVPESPVYEATGTWKYSYSNFNNDCGFPDPIDSGTLNITQNGNLITLVDDQSGQLLLPIVGYVDGSSYYFVKVYPHTNGTKSGIIGELFSLVLSSSKNGSGDCNWKWINTSNSSDSCGGGWDVLINSIANTIPSNSLLLLND
jgi:hypothetical protein